MCPKSFFSKYFQATVVDLAIVSTALYLIKIVLSNFIVVEYLTIVLLFSILWPLCFFFGYLGFSSTIGKSIFGLKVEVPEEKKIRTLLIREFGLKFPVILGLVASLYYYNSTRIVDFVDLHILIIVFSFFLINAIAIITTGKAVMYIFSKSSKIVSTAVKPTSLVLWLGLFVFIFMVTILVNNSTQKSDFSVFGITLPEQFPEYPHNVDPYTDFLSKQKSAHEYVFELFEKYDIVILCEPSHAENKNWDFFSSVVSDKRFIQNIGNVFTEYGNINQQASLNNYLSKRFEQPDSLEMATSAILHIRNRGFFNYLKNVNALNNTLPDSLKIEHWFCDVPGIHEYVYTPIDTVHLYNRDSLMAQVVIDKFRNEISTGSRKKCLVITNYRHAYNLRRRIRNENQAEFIFDQFPGKVANVLINSYTNTNHNVMYPIQAGKWDKAFALNSNKPVGFTLRNTVFGKEPFDHYFFESKTVTYQEVFTGLIFTVSLKEWENNSSVPFSAENYDKAHKKAGIEHFRPFKERSNFFDAFLGSIYNLHILLVVLFLQLLAIMAIFFRTVSLYLGTLFSSKNR